MKNKQLMILARSLRGTLLIFLVISFLFSTKQKTQPVLAESSSTSQCQTGKNCIFLPLLSLRVPEGDLVLGNVEVTQAVQDTKNTVPMVADRPTVLRIFATTGSAARALSDVQVQVTATRGDVALTGSPTSFKTSIPLSNSRADYSSTVNMKLPQSWLSGTIDLNIRLDPENLINETNEDNNNLSIHLTFQAVPVLNVKIVPIRYTHTPNNVTYAAPKVDTLSDYIIRIFPINKVNISWHSEVAYTGDLRSVDTWYDLLDKVTSIKSSEGAPPSTVYYGLIPVENNSSDGWFTGGVAGMGWVGSRTAIGLNTGNSGPQIAAHEIGHNMGMGHTPCNVPDADPNYPYANGSIGQYGLDVVSGTVYSPEYNRDLMGYCNPKWISDYTYKNIMQAQIRYGASQQSTLSALSPSSEGQRSLLVRAKIGADGAKLLPVYVLQAQQNQAPEAGEYGLQLIGTDGTLFSEVPVRANTIALDGEESLGINSLIPLPAQPVALVRLVKDGKVLAEQALEPTGSDKTIQVETKAVDDSTILLRWNETGPALVRYTTDSGKTWTTLNVDQAGGMLKINLAALPAQGGEFEVTRANTWN
jgi:hypothetical protein